MEGRPNNISVLIWTEILWMNSPPKEPQRAWSPWDAGWYFYGIVRARCRFFGVRKFDADGK